MENNISTQSCKNCTFFVQHYAYVDGEYCETYCGHCICLEDKSRTDFIVKRNNICSLFKKRPKQ